MDSVLLISLLTMGCLALILSIGLVIADRKLRVEEDPRVEEINNLLPNANCGACGFSGCHAYAELVVKAETGIDICTPGGADVAKKIAEIMRLEATGKEVQIAVIRCQGGNKESKKRFRYQGIASCRAVNSVAGGSKACIYGCLGFGDCVRVCPFNALGMNDNNIPEINEDKCTGCGLCVKACPRNIISLVSKNQKVYLGCISQDKGKVVKEICSVGCFSCGLCVSPKITPDGAIMMKKNLPEIITERIKDWTILDKAVSKCPAKCFKTRG